MPIPHILAATDLSSSSLHAVERAMAIAGRIGARCTVLHALGLDAMAPLRALLGARAPALYKGVEDEARAALARMVADAKARAGASADVLVDHGTVVEAVHRQAEALGAALVVLGAHGQGFLQRLILGSTASRVLRTSARPVLVVKEPCRAAYRRVLVAVDFSAASVAALRLAREVAPGAELVLLHAFEVPFEGKLHYAGVEEDAIRLYRSELQERALAQLHESAAAAGLGKADYSARVLRGNPSRCIVSAEETHDCDLVVAGKHGASVTEDLLLGSVTQHLLAESRSDVLVATGGS